MIPVHQTRIGVGPDVPLEARGNCYAACVASILELPLSAVPDIDDRGEKNRRVWLRWYGERGLYPVNLVGEPETVPGYSIGTVGSPTSPGFWHAVVCHV